MQRENKNQYERIEDVKVKKYGRDESDDDSLPLLIMILLLLL